MLEAEAWFWRREREGVDDPDLRTALRSVLPFAHADVVARRYGTTGPKETVVLACSSGGAALGLAAELIASGEVPLALAGGVDAMTRICFMGFNALKLLDPEPCRPFARDRRGMSLGEGAGFVVLEDEAHARARGARGYAELASYGLTTDAWHLTAPASRRGGRRPGDGGGAGSGGGPGERRRVHQRSRDRHSPERPRGGRGAPASCSIRTRCS